MENKGKRDFDAAAATWDNEPRRLKLAQEVVAAITSRLPLTAGMTALDYGCGSGLVTLGLHGFVSRITGADSSQGMLDVLDAKVAERGIDNVTTLHIDLEHQEAIPGKYDLIVSSMTMHHVKDVEGLVQSLVASLNPGGWLALADLEKEDGSFHADTVVEHNGFEREFFPGTFQRAGLSEIGVVTAAVVEKGERSYPVLLAFGSK
ncbi:class I SAM-dependent DNA methyltransferase [Geomesophilobacter sediminis]|uniref:Class I SAM-dependent methyltransferase n=1 Tax=Geomesophilobacter sediminis TaxID=2798584 RepID=A0A8J7S8L7_9BACT|nr:class I SAM-dependent methyltransferase [Geomesophilobacter sediminis]MBJ6727736.1 class I SAM-dependent methyltransferase [Geomesophilobacter sediminis]